MIQIEDEHNPLAKYFNVDTLRLAKDKSYREGFFDGYSSVGSITLNLARAIMIIGKEEKEDKQKKKV